ncbi:RING-type E3 ubiquitin transferase [Heracleum sosnowskyi]|uniref:RING-type E3 ubiquitin transferase n=1 Tax=Heracleum sosnowskyi TaxID=360622 RepID=A0AAD8MZR4_9APIA|nr:RING-type E3 ubiquitin transferase [Heracleum sosnowskyi]
MDHDSFWFQHSFTIATFGIIAIIVTLRRCFSTITVRNQQAEALPNKTVVLDIRSIPTHRYIKGNRQSAECAVCLGEFEDNQELRTLPKCKHSFHVDCIDMWLYSHPSCPTCRTNTMPSPSPEEGVSVQVAAGR